MAARAVVFGYGDIGVRGLQALLGAGVEVPLVVTHRDDPKEARWYASLADFSQQKGIPVAYSAPGKLPGCDFVFSFYYREMLPMALLRQARRGAYNLHGSLLPKYRGRAPLNWAILHGEKETGVTLHQMVEKPDAGGIVDQQAVPIGPDETAVEVFRKLVDATEKVLKKNLSKLIAGTVTLRAQNLSEGSYFGRRTPEDGRIDWTKSAREIHDLVRAVAPPFPGAFSGKLRVLKTKLTEQKHSRPYGPYEENGEWFAACGDGKVLRLLSVEER